ncbi:MAG: D-alanyl-D-alanine endopeptidase [Burkholderiales bacterium]|nr:D-alanyl-D-alanine endopeptidase [Burkholderiales bacterium]
MDKSQIGGQVQLSISPIIATFSATLMFCVATCAVAQTPRNTTKVKPAAARAKPTGVADFNKDGMPNLQSHAFMVFDPITGRALFSKNADQAVPIASITKLMTAMVVLEAKLDMDEALIVDKDDIDMLKGSRSRIPVGAAFRREDLMRLALMASDNRAAAALGRTYPGGTVAFVEAMNAKAHLLGLQNAKFVDPTGLAPGNVASPQDLALLVSAASTFPEIREFSTAQELHVTLATGGRSMGFNNTNALVRSQGWNIGLSKTGFINEAGKCLVMHATIANNPVVIVLLDSWGKLTRIGDANRIKKWLETQKVAEFAAKKG